jgi:hypothetical protein
MVKINMSRYPVASRINSTQGLEYETELLATSLEEGSTYYIKDFACKKRKYGFSCTLVLFDVRGIFVDDSIIGLGADESSAIQDAYQKAGSLKIEIMLIPSKNA